MSEVIEETPTPEAVEEAPQPEAPDPAPEPAPDPAPAGPNWDDPAVLNEAAQRIAALGYQIVQPEAPERETPPEPEFDPFDPESVRAYVQAQVQAERDQILAQIAPVQQFAAEQTRAQQEQGLADRIVQARTDAGYTPPGEDPAVMDDRIRGLAEGLFQQAAQQLPQPTSPLQAAHIGEQARQLAEQAVRDAVQFFADHDKQVKDAGVAEYLASLTADGSTLYEPGVSSAALNRDGEPRNEREAAARFLARRQAQPV